MLKCLRKILEMRGSAGFACDNKGFNVRRWNNNNNGIYNEETKFSVTPSFVLTHYLLIQSSTLKKCIEHCLTALATLLHVIMEFI